MLIEGVKEEIERLERELKRLAQELPSSTDMELPDSQTSTPSWRPTPSVGQAPSWRPTPFGEQTPSQSQSQIPVALQLPDISDEMSQADIATVMNLVKLFAQAVKNSDSLTLSYVTTMLNQIFEKYQKKNIAAPFFSIYSFLQRLESLKKFQNKDDLINVSASKLASVLRGMGAIPVSSRIMLIETYDYFKRARSGKVVWAVDFSHKSVPKRRCTLTVGVKVKNMQPTVEKTFTDIKGKVRSFDEVTLASYAKGDIW